MTGVTPQDIALLRLLPHTLSYPRHGRISMHTQRMLDRINALKALGLLTHSITDAGRGFVNMRCDITAEGARVARKDVR